MLSIQRLGGLAARLFAELLSPSGCAACDAPVAAHALFCPPCAVSVERSGPEGGVRLDGHAAFAYGGAIATAIVRLKYRDRPDLGGRLGRAMAPAARGLRRPIDLVVPVPLHPRRLAERGYNPAALLAAPVARMLPAPLVHAALARARDTPRQATLDREARLANVAKAFVAGRRSVTGARVLLVDDVETTGATLAACVSVLRRAGARGITTLVLARRS